MRRDIEQPRTLYRLNELVPGSERTIRVGTVVAPDETEPFRYIPVEFDKVLTDLREFSIKGEVTINGEPVRQTAEYSYGLEPVAIVTGWCRQFGAVARGKVALKVIDSPIYVLPVREDAPSYRRDQREYYPIENSSWFNISTPEGKDFFDRWAETQRDPDYDLSKWSSPEQQALRDEAHQHYIHGSVTEHEFYDSDWSPEQNVANIEKLMAQYEKKFDPDRLRRIVGLETA